MFEAGLVLRVAARFQRCADQPAGQRRKDRKLTKPVNPPRGISRDVVEQNGRTEEDHHDEEHTTTPHRTDIQPKDVFTPKPRNMNVLNYVQQGWPGEADDYDGMDHVIRNQVPRDKGWDTVKNLSQYLIKTEGGGGTKAVGTK